MWRYFGLMDGVTFAKGVGLGTLLNVSVILYVYRSRRIARRVRHLRGAADAAAVGSRASFRLISEFAHRRNQRGMRVVIYGAGDIAASAVRDMLGRRHGGYRMIGFIVEDPAMERAHMQGYPVIGNYQKLTADREGRRRSGRDHSTDRRPRLEQLRELCAERRVSLERLHFELDQLVAAS